MSCPQNLSVSESEVDTKPTPAKLKLSNPCVRIRRLSLIEIGKARFVEKEKIQSPPLSPLRKNKNKF